MVKKLLSNFTLLLAMMVAGAGSAWADTVLFEDTFNDLTGGSNTSTNHQSSTKITERDGWYKQGFSNVYPAAGAVKFGTSSAIGKMRTDKSFNTSGKTCHVVVKVKGWTTVEGNIKVTPTTGNAQTKSYTSTISGDFQELDFTFTDGGEATDFEIASTAKRAFVDNVKIFIEDSKADAEFSFGPTTAFEVATNADFTAPTLTTAAGYDGTIAYSSNNEIVARVNASTGEVTIGNVEGTATITASAAATENFMAGQASYTITVVDNRQVPTLSFSAEEVRIALNATEGDYTLPTLNNPANLAVTYESSDDNIITEVGGEFIVATEAVGEATMTATFAGNDTYKPATAEFKVVIYDPNAKGTKNNPYSVLEVIAMEPTNTSGTSVAGDIWVKGFIVGSYGSNSQPTNVVANFQESNLALADSYDETDSEFIIPVQLKKETAPRINFNPVAKPYNANVAQVLVRADVFKYFEVPGLKNTSEIEKVAEQVNISNAGMATYYTDCALDFTDFTDMYAYTATVSGNTITFSRVMQVPANTGVLLRNPAEAAASNVVPVATGTVDPVEGNKFVGTLTDITVDGDDCYILNNSTTNGLGFYKVKASGSKVGAHRAYLKTGTDGVRSFIGFSEGDANGIESVGAEAARSMEVYNLQGVRVAQPTKGLYIMNGKKVIFK